MTNLTLVISPLFKVVKLVATKVTWQNYAGNWRLKNKMQLGESNTTQLNSCISRITLAQLKISLVAD